MDLIWISIFGHILIVLGCAGVVCRWDNVSITLLAIELIVLGVAIHFPGTASMWSDISGQIVYIYLLVLAGVEAAVGLSLLIVFYRLRGIITIAVLEVTKG